MGKRGPRSLDRKPKRIIRKSLDKAHIVQEFDKAWHQAAKEIGTDKLAIVIQNQEEIQRREAKIVKEAKAEELQEKAVPATSTSSSSSCISPQLQAELAKAKGLGIWQ